MNKFEQLIEYVINDEESKARELFHEIVVEKSRTIYEEMMQEEDEIDEEEIDEGMEDMGGDQADDLIDDIETEEQGISMEGEDDMEGADEIEMADDEEDADIEDRVVDLEDKLDQLMAEFESIMGDEGAEDADMEMDSDMDIEMDSDMDSEEVVDDEFETEGMYENVDLKAAPKPVTSEEGSVNKKSTVAANAGAKGAQAHPVKMTGDVAQGRSAPSVKDMGSTTKPDVKPAAKPHLAQATGVNTKSVIQ
jgi:hypothetical protein